MKARLLSKDFWHRHFSVQGPRFILTGALCSALALLFMWCATGILGIHYLVATFLGFFILNPIGFLLNRIFTFSATGASWKVQIFRYHFALIGSLLVNLILIALLVDGLGVHYLAATVVSMIVTMVLNYVAHEKWSFRRR